MTFRSFEFHNHWVLFLMVPALALLYWSLWRRKTAPAILFPSILRLKGFHPTFRQSLRFLVPVLQAVAVLGFIAALARPRQGDAKTVVRSQGIAIEMVLDRSSSMEEPVRYAGADRKKVDIVKEIFSNFIVGGGGLSGRKTDLIGLTTFARFTEESCPLISLHEPLITSVKNFSTVPPALDQYDQPTRDLSNPRERKLKPNPLNATAIGEGIQRAVLSLVTAEEDLARGEDQGGYKIKGKVIILLTDGENNAGMDPVEAGRYAAANGIRLYYVVIRDRTETQDTIFGRRIVRELSEDQILEEPREAVKESGGKAFLATNGDELLNVYKEIDKLERSEIGRIEFRSYQEKYRWFLLPAIACALLSLFLGETVFRSLP